MVLCGLEAKEAAAYREKSTVAVQPGRLMHEQMQSRLNG